MFTGIVQACGRVAVVEPRPYGMRLVVDRHGWEGQALELGDSICVSGVCLTLVAADAQTLSFDVVAQTLAMTTLGQVKVGTGVNLERALTPSTPMGGHFVQGHVDGVGRVARVQRAADQWRLTIEPGAVPLADGRAQLVEAIIPRGSIAIDGVSLTVAAVGRSDFEVALIPTTLERTTLSDLREGDRVNLEADIVSKTVVHWLTDRFGQESGLTMDVLRRAGFS